MKKTAALLLCALLLFAGCSKLDSKKEKTKIAVDGQFLLTAHSAQGEFSCTFVLTEGGFEAEYISPASMAGLKLYESGGRVLMSFAGAEVPLGGDAIKTAFPCLAAAALKKCLSGEAEVKNSKELLQFTGETDSIEFLVNVKADTGLPNKIEFSSLSLTVNFAKT